MLQSVRGLSIVAASVLFGCPSRIIRTETDADVVTSEVLDEPPAPDAMLDANEAAVADAAPDMAPLDAPEALDAQTDVVLLDALDAAPTDVPVEASLDTPADTGGPTYRVDRSIELLSPRIGTQMIPFPTTPSNNKEGECGDGIFGGVNMEEPSDPNESVWVNRFQFLCHGLRADGRISPPSSYLAPINMSPVGRTTAVGLERCPDGFVLVGLRGEETLGNYSGTYSASRIGAVCARVSEWASVTEMRPTESTPIFERARLASSADAGAPRDAADGDGGPIGSDNLVPLRACGDVDPSVPACVFPIHGGRPVNPMGMPTQRRAFFVTCPGGYVPFAYAATAGYFVDALEVRCARLRVTR